MNLKITDTTSAPPAAARPQSEAITLGSQLRQAREARGISLRYISDATRISMRHLEAIEADEYKQLPGGIFNRSFVKAFAKQVGFNEDEAIQLYNRAARESGEPEADDTPISYRPQVYTNGDSSRPPLVTIALSIIILAGLCYAVFAGLNWYRNRSESQSATPSTALDNQAAISATPQSDLAQLNAAATNATPPIAVNQQQMPGLSSEGLRLRLAAMKEDVSLTLKTDDGKPESIYLRAGDTPREFSAQERASLRYARSRAASLVVEINGRNVTRIPTDQSASVNELSVTRDNIAQLTQQ